MGRNRLLIRLVLIVVVVAIFFARGGQRNPQMLRAVGIALVAGLIVLGIRLAYEASKRKKTEQNQQLAAGSKDVDLFTKPKDF